MAVRSKPPIKLAIVPGAAAAQRSADLAAIAQQAAGDTAHSLLQSLSARFVVQSVPELLPNARTLGDTPTITFDWGAAGIVLANVPDRAITYAKIQDVSAGKVLGSVAGGAVEEISVTAAGRALLGDADAAAQRTTLGLGQVENTSDADKPVSSAQAAADNLRQLLSEKGVANGYAPLDASNLVPAVHLPSYVDDVVE
jgi:hypothetical protein